MGRKLVVAIPTGAIVPILNVCEENQRFLLPEDFSKYLDEKEKQISTALESLVNDIGYSGFNIKISIETMQGQKPEQYFFWNDGGGSFLGEERSSRSPTIGYCLHSIGWGFISAKKIYESYVPKNPLIKTTIDIYGRRDSVTKIVRIEKKK